MPDRKPNDRFPHGQFGYPADLDLEQFARKIDITREIASQDDFEACIGNQALADVALLAGGNDRFAIFPDFARQSRRHPEFSRRVFGKDVVTFVKHQHMLELFPALVSVLAQHHIVGAFGSRELRSLKRDDLQAFLDTKSSLSFSTADHLRWDLKQIFDMALAEGIVARHPALLLFTPRQCAQPEHRALSMKEVKLIFAALGLRERLIVKLAVLAGMRPGEIFGLKRGRIDGSSILVEQRVYRGIIDTPKTEKSKRLVAVSSGLRGDLEQWLSQDPGGKPDDWLFPSETLVTPLAKDNVMYRHIRPVLRKIGFGWVDFHVLRRTHSSLMRELGVDPKVVADGQGHTLDVNLNVYSQTSLEQKIEAVEQLAAAFVN